MKTTIALACLVLGAAAWQAADAPGPSAFTVLDQQPAPGPRVTAYLQYQLDRAWQQDEARLAAYAAVQSAADLASLKRRTRERLLAAIGGLPETRTPLNARVVGVVSAQGYRIEKVIFESVPGLHVTALVYVPDGPPGCGPWSSSAPAAATAGPARPASR